MQYLNLEVPSSLLISSSAPMSKLKEYFFSVFLWLGIFLLNHCFPALFTRFQLIHARKVQTCVLSLFIDKLGVLYTLFSNTFFSSTFLQPFSLGDYSLCMFDF